MQKCGEALQISPFHDRLCFFMELVFTFSPDKYAGQFQASHEPVWRNDRKQGFSMPFARRVAVRRNGVQFNLPSAAQ
jgi:hypothetical protein